MKMRLFTGMLAIATLAGLTIGATTASAARKDPDRDGLNTKRERKIGTNPRKADTDRDSLKDGREVLSLGTDPLSADSDDDGVRDGREVREGLNPRDDDSDDDGVEDALEVKGTITEITETSVTITRKYGDPLTVVVDDATFLKAPDRDGDGAVTLADFQVGDRIEANVSDDLSTALSLERKLSRPDSGGENEVKGVISDITDGQVTLSGREGQTIATFTVDSDTSLRAPDRDESGTVTVGDLEVGDRVEAHLTDDGTRALSLEVEYDERVYGGDDGYEDDRREEVKGLVTEVTETTISIQTRSDGIVTLTVDPEAMLKVPDRDSSGYASLADFQVGDRVEAKVSADGQTAFKVEYDGPESEDEGEDSGDDRSSVATQQPQGDTSADTGDQGQESQDDHGQDSGDDQSQDSGEDEGDDSGDDQGQESQDDHGDDPEDD